MRQRISWNLTHLKFFIYLFSKLLAILIEINLHWLISVPLFCLKITPVMFFSKHVKKNYFNVVIELLPNPGLV